MPLTVVVERLRRTRVLFVGLLGFLCLGCSTAPPTPKTAPSEPQPIVVRAPTEEEWKTVVRLLFPLLLVSRAWGPADGCPVALGIQPRNSINVGIGLHDKCKFSLVITEGALTTLPPDELQAALAHELGHLQLGHVAARQQRRAAEKGMLELHPGGTTGGVDTAALEREYRAYDRAEEGLADHYGLDLLGKVIGRPRACQAEVGLLERLVKVKSSSEIWLRTHPNPADRIKVVQEECSAPESGR